MAAGSELTEAAEERLVRVIWEEAAGGGRGGRQQSEQDFAEFHEFFLKFRRHE